MEEGTRNLLIKDVNVAVRVKRIMEKHKVKTLGELAEYKPEQLFKLSGGSRKFVEEAQGILEKYGLSLNEFNHEKYGGF